MLKTQPKTRSPSWQAYQSGQKSIHKMHTAQTNWKKGKNVWKLSQKLYLRETDRFATVEACISTHISQLQGYPQHSTATLYFMLSIWHPLDFLSCCLCIKILCIKDFCVWTQHWKAGKGMSPGCCMSSLCQQMVSQAEHSLLRKNVLRFHCILLCLNSNYIEGKIITLQLKIKHLTHREHCCTS